MDGLEPDHLATTTRLGTLGMIIMDTFKRLTSPRSDDSVAVIRTVTPLVWAAVIDIVLRATGVDLSSLNDDLERYVVLVLGVVLYLIGKFRPGLIERVLLMVKVDGTNYDRTS